MMLPEENQPDQVRVSVSALLEFAARLVSQVPGVCGTPEQIVRFIRVSSHDEYLPPTEKIDPHLTPLILEVSLCLDVESNYASVALAVQRRLFQSISNDLQLPVHRVNIEIDRVKWTRETTKERGT